MKTQGICDSCGKTGDLPLNTSKPIGWFSVNVASSASSSSMTYCAACYGTIAWPVGLVPTPEPTTAPSLPAAL